MIIVIIQYFIAVHVMKFVEFQTGDVVTLPLCHSCCRYFGTSVVIDDLFVCY